MYKLFIFYLYILFTFIHCSNALVDDYNFVELRAYKKVTGYTFNIDAYIATQGTNRYSGSTELVQQFFQGNYNREKTPSRLNSLFVNRDVINFETPFVVSLFDSNIRYFEVDVTGISNRSDFAHANSFTLSAGGSVSVDRTKYRLYFSDFLLGASNVIGLASRPSVNSVSPRSNTWIRGFSSNTASTIAHELGHTFSIRHTNESDSCTGGTRGGFIMNSFLGSNSIKFANCEISILKQALDNLAARFPDTVQTVDYLYENIALDSNGSSILNNNLAVLYSADDPNRSSVLELGSHSLEENHVMGECGVEH